MSYLSIDDKIKIINEEMNKNVKSEAKTLNEILLGEILDYLIKLNLNNNFIGEETIKLLNRIAWILGTLVAVSLSKTLWSI